jgi:hypothetical protein
MTGIGLIHDVDFLLSTMSGVLQSKIIVLTNHLYHVILDPVDPESCLDIQLDGFGGAKIIRYHSRLSESFTNAGAVKPDIVTTVDELGDCFEQYCDMKRRTMKQNIKQHN